MKSYGIVPAAIAALVLCGCSHTVIKNTGNSECEFRVHTDRERCLQNVKSSDEAMLARKNAKRDANRGLEAPTREDLEAAEGKRAP